MLYATHPPSAPQRGDATPLPFARTIADPRGGAARAPPVPGPGWASSSTASSAAYADFGYRFELTP